MKTRIGTLAVLTSALAFAPVAEAAPTKVKVRVEGATKTIFEGSVTTDAHPVDGGDGSGAHTCDGTNGGANAVGGPTATGALDTAATERDFGWSGSWSDDFEDFVVNDIGGDEATSTQFWGVAVNRKPLQIGGCQYQVADGDEVLWAYDLFSKKHVLRLRGFRRTRVGRAYRVKVIDGQTGDPVKGARVAGRRTDENGVARLRFKARGTKRLKARHADAVRSNQIRVKVLRKRRR